MLTSSVRRYFRCYNKCHSAEWTSATSLPACLLRSLSLVPSFWSFLRLVLLVLVVKRDYAWLSWVLCSLENLNWTWYIILCKEIHVFIIFIFKIVYKSVSSKSRESIEGYSKWKVKKNKSGDWTEYLILLKQAMDTDNIHKTFVGEIWSLKPTSFIPKLWLSWDMRFMPLYFLFSIHYCHLISRAAISNWCLDLDIVFFFLSVRHHSGFVLCREASGCHYVVRYEWQGNINL